MNLRNIANAAIQCINPDQEIVWKRSIGYTVDENYRQVPAYEEVICWGNVQSVGDEMLRQLNNLNIAGVMRSIYLSENAMGISFRQMRGGDFLEFREYEGVDTTTWKVVHTAETWDNWCHVIAVQQ